MIRRLQQHGLLESAAPRAISSAKLPEPMLADAMPEPDELDVQAYRDGYAEGFKAGEEDGRREAEQFHQAWEEQTRQRMEEEHRLLVQEREQLAALTANLYAQLRTHEEGMEQLAFELALSSLARLLGNMQEDGELMRRICQQMAEAYRGKAVKLEVAPADSAHLPERIEGLDVVVEHALSTGECRLVTERGYAETSVVHRLSAIYNAMLETLGLEVRP
jgi:flagellar biosynthesis/type III secretory pathway protein FliH